MVYIVDRLEKVLRAWEDYWFLLNVVNKIQAQRRDKPVCPKEKAMVNYGSFRKFLLGLRKDKKEIDVNRFQEPNHESVRGQFLTSLASEMVGWCKDSRRVFHLTQELQILLDATSLDKVCWKDVRAPFSSFAVALERPIIDCEGDLFDFILVHAGLARAQNKIVHGRIWFRFFNKKCDNYTPLTQPNRQNILNRIQKGQWLHVEKLTIRFLDRIDKNIIGSHFSIAMDCGEELVTATAERVFKRANNEDRENFQGSLDGALPLWDSMIRIVIGMCLYLKTLPPKNPHVSKWKKTPRIGIPDPKAITNEAEICTVSSYYKLTTEEIEVLGLDKEEKQRAHYEVRCHFREGYWRRPPGRGHDPTAEKTVWVRPTIVRRDRLQENQLPGGTKKIM